MKKTFFLIVFAAITINLNSQTYFPLVKQSTQGVPVLHEKPASTYRKTPVNLTRKQNQSQPISYAVTFFGQNLR